MSVKLYVPHKSAEIKPQDQEELKEGEEIALEELLEGTDRVITDDKLSLTDAGIIGNPLEVEIVIKISIDV